ncbi:MAG: hypothetical protein KatS3mg124_2189 [Porticoccaceae bacterium]|nr:MAG: hypothetical protein KatS3mg124_2189 [Porticoccaceae bacterium]
MSGLLLFFHLLGAAVWTGGHLVLALGVLPEALRRRDPAMILQFEARFERLGVPALLVQVVTGVALAYRWLPDVAGWLDLANPLARPIAAKFALLAATAALALDARLRLIPRLTPARLPALAWHVGAVTALALAFVAVGLSFRTGWLY